MKYVDKMYCFISLSVMINMMFSQVWMMTSVNLSDTKVRILITTTQLHIDWQQVQKKSFSIANTLELCLFCSYPLTST